MSKTYREDCGCKHDGARWLELCQSHGTEERELHERAQRERIERMATVARDNETAWLEA